MKKFAIAFVVFVLLISFCCKQVDLTAPGGATLTLAAQPLSVDKNGTVVLTVTGTRGNGAPLPDETVIRFTVDENFGVVNPNPVETTNGVAQATFVAGQRSGEATITAFSGDANADITVTIGDAAVSKIILTADPSSLPIGGGKSRLKAFVRDENGNPVSGIQVFFQTTSGTLASHGEPVVTDNAGVARDTLNTQQEATVTASVSGDVGDAQITISVTAGEGPTCSFASATTGAVGEDIFFVDTSSDPDGTIEVSHWEFGDGDSANGETVSHSYDNAGSFVVVHSVTDNTGLTDTCAPVTITIEEGQAPQCAFVVSPSGDLAVNQLASFADTSTDTDGTIDRSLWDFGDGKTAEGLTVTHAYTAPGDYFVLHTAIDDDGLSSTCTPLAIHVGGTPSVSINDVSGSEATTSLTFTISLSSSTSLPVNVTYQTSDCDGTATATAGSDYVAVPPTVATIPASSTSTTINITILNDTSVEGTETFCVDLSGPVNATLGDPRGVGSITDND